MLSPCSVHWPLIIDHSLTMVRVWRCNDHWAVRWSHIFRCWLRSTSAACLWKLSPYTLTFWLLSLFHNGQCSMVNVQWDLSGGYCGGVPPLPIPNREVKPACADGTAMQCGRVGGRHFSMRERLSQWQSLFFCFSSWLTRTIIFNILHTCADLCNFLKLFVEKFGS